MVNLYRRGRIQEKKVENPIKSNDTETMIKKLTSKLEYKLSQHYL